MRFSIKLKKLAIENDLCKEHYVFIRRPVQKHTMLQFESTGMEKRKMDHILFHFLLQGKVSSSIRLTSSLMFSFQCGNYKRKRSARCKEQISQCYNPFHKILRWELGKGNEIGTGMDKRTKPGHYCYCRILPVSTSTIVSIQK